MMPHQLAMWRRQQGLSQRAAAEALGCAKRSIVTWEGGKSEIPRYIALAASAIRAGLPPYPGEGEPSS